MKPQEFRIGNLVYDEISGELMTVCDLSTGSITGYVIDRSKFPLSEPFKIAPLKITEEILLNFGFEIKGRQYERQDWWICLEFPKDGKYLCIDWDTNKDLISVQYVHQLQNLYFILTGEEL